jgi:hypothetical protein
MASLNGRLRQFRNHLQQLAGDDDRFRPFICEGSPFDCRVFLIGVNPASEVPFWDYWHDDTGFNRACWLDQYKLLRQARPSKSGRGGRQVVSTIRQRIERFVIAAQPEQVLETNLYSLPTPSEPAVRDVRRDTKVIEFLLSEIQPDVLVLHGYTATEQFRGAFGYPPTAIFSKAKIAGRFIWVVGTRHFSLLSLDAAGLLGKEVGSRLQTRN